MKIRVPVKPKATTPVPDFREALNPETANSTITLANVRPPDNPENTAIGARYMEDHEGALRTSITMVRDFILDTLAIQSLAIENGAQDAREVLVAALDEEPDLTHIVDMLRTASRTSISIQTVDFMMKFTHLPNHMRPLLIATCLGSRQEGLPSVESVLRRLESALDRSPRIEKPVPKAPRRHQEEEKIVRRKGSS